MIEIIDEHQQLSQAHEGLIRDILAFAARQLGMDAPGLSVSIVSEEEIQAINRDFRHIDASTDVLSFPLDPTADLMEEFADLMDDEEYQVLNNYLGDLLISYPHIEQQAEEYNHSFERELGFLVVHGFLHLNGYDHETPEDEEVMYALQEKVLTDYGLERK